MKIALRVCTFATVVAGLMMIPADDANAQLFSKIFKRGGECCCEPAPEPEPECCCEPEPEPEPVCCEPAPEPVCCEPEPEPIPCCEPEPEPAPCCCVMAEPEAEAEPACGCVGMMTPGFNLAPGETLVAVSPLMPMEGVNFQSTTELAVR